MTAWKNIEHGGIPEGRDILCRFPAWGGSYVTYVAQYSDRNKSFVTLAGNFAPPTHWTEIPK